MTRLFFSQENTDRSRCQVQGHGRRGASNQKLEGIQPNAGLPLELAWFLGKGSKIKLIIFAEFSAKGVRGVPHFAENNQFLKMLRKCSECSETWNKAIRFFSPLWPPTHPWHPTWMLTTTTCSHLSEGIKKYSDEFPISYRIHITTCTSF